MNARHTRSASAAWTARLALLAALCFGGHAMAQSEPTMDQVYQEAQAGRVDHALQLMQPVLRAHPNSAKAHYVDAELLARQGAVSQARDALRTAERLAPGLPFARVDAVQKLQRALTSGAPVMALASMAPSSLSPALAATAPPAVQHSAVPWGVLLAVCGGALLAWVLMRLGKPAAAPGMAAAAVPAWSSAGASPTYAGGASVPGAGLGSGIGTMAAPGLGSQVAGGLATGLAVGAGVMAAEAIGKSLFGGDRRLAGGFAAQPGNLDTPRFEPIPEDINLNSDMGGTDFGIQNAGSWDDDAAPTGDWDS